jgi:hypothetical protein
MQHLTNNTFVPTLPDHRPQGIHNFFLPCQLRFISDPSRKRIVEKSRQIGISLTAAYDLVRKTSPAGSSSDAWVSSRDGSYSPVASDVSPITSSSAAPPHLLCLCVLSSALAANPLPIPSPSVFETYLCRAPRTFRTRHGSTDSEHPAVERFADLPRPTAMLCNAAAYRIARFRSHPERCDGGGPRIRSFVKRL